MSKEELLDELKSLRDSLRSKIENNENKKDRIDPSKSEKLITIGKIEGLRESRDEVIELINRIENN